MSDSDNGSSISNSNPPTSPSPSNPDATALSLLSSNLSSLFLSPFCSDAVLVHPTSPVPVHRCVLSARSPFFLDLFSADDSAHDLQTDDLLPAVTIGYDALLVVVGYLYTGKVGALPRGVCVCAESDLECEHVGCRPAVDFLVEVLYASEVFRVSELVSLFQRHLLDILDRVPEDDMLVVLSIANLCSKSCEKLLSKSIEIVIHSTLDYVTLKKTLPPDIVKHVTESRTKSGLLGPDGGIPNKHVMRIHQALDCDDVELVKMLLKENNMTLDDACALHYAVAHCDSKTTTELLDLGIADVNHRNARGYTVLHIAAMRREPKIIMLLLSKDARPSDATSDGRKALQISRRLTKLVDYNRPTEKGAASNADQLCIEILENAEMSNPVVGEAGVQPTTTGLDLRSQLLYLEIRVGLAKVFFPEEAKIAMNNAKVDGTLEFVVDAPGNASQGRRGLAVDKAPFRGNEELLSRMRALSRTVELGRQFFPRCAGILDKIMAEEDTSVLANNKNDTSEEKLRKKRRFQELQDELLKAFTMDKEENVKSGISATSSSFRTKSKMARK